MKLGAVIVGYNSETCIAACLEACLRYAEEFGAGIVVVDNASADGTAQVARRHAGVKVVSNPTNRGFAGAANQGFRMLAGAEAVLILNPDAVLLDSPSALARELEVESTGAAAGQLLDANGRPQVGFQVRRFPTPEALALENLGLNRLWPGNPVNRRYRCRDLDPRQRAEVEQPAGACLLVRREAYEAAGGFDEGFYPVWFEDVDLLKRMAVLGWRARYTPAFRCRHLGGHSFSSITWRQRHVYWYGSLLRYAARHFGTLGFRTTAGSAVLGWLPRMCLGLVFQRDASRWTDHLKVLRLVWSSFWKGRAEALLPAKGSQAGVKEEYRPAGS